MIVRAVIERPELIDNFDLFNDAYDTMAFLLRVKADQSVIDRLADKVRQSEYAGILKKFGMK